MRCASALLTLAAAMLVPAAADAAPPWSAPRNLGAPHQFVNPVGVTASGDGTVLAWWAWQDGLYDDARLGWSLASRPTGAAGFGRELPGPRGLFAVVGFAAQRALAGIHREVGPPAAQRSLIQVRFGRTSGAFGRARTVADDDRQRRPRLAANASGDAALAWFADRGTANDRVLVSLRRAGRSFGHPIRLAEGRIRSVAVAVGPRGDVLVAWDARGTIRARYRRSMGARFAATETIRSNPTFFADIQAAVADNGRSYLAWSAQFLSEGGDRGPALYEVAVRPSGHRFRAAQLLERQGAERSQGPVRLAVSGRDATVAWTGFDGATGRARVAATDRSGRFGPAQDVSPPAHDAVVSDLATGRGTRLVVWGNGGIGTGQVFAASALATPPILPFGAPEAVSAVDQASAGRISLAARPTVVWTSRPSGSRPARTFVHAATRGDDR